MAPRTLPGLGLQSDWSLGENGWKAGMDWNLFLLSVLTNGSVISRIAALPGAPANGDSYILTAGPNINRIAVRDKNQWQFIDPKRGWEIFDSAFGRQIVFNGASWYDPLDELDAAVERAEEAADAAQGVVAGRSLVYPASPAPEVYNAGGRRIGNLADAVDPQDAATKAQLDAIIIGSPTTSVISYGADVTGVADSRQAFIDAQAAAMATNSRYVLVPQGYYKISDVVDIESYVTWVFQGPRLYHDDNTKTILRASGKTGFNILGQVTLIGTLVPNQSPPTSWQKGIDDDYASEIGLLVEDCRQAVIENVFVRDFDGVGIHHRGTGALNPTNLYGDKVRYKSVAAENCVIGIERDAGSGGEYCQWLGMDATGCYVGLYDSAGNHTTVGGSIVSNYKGITLRSGSNHLHGITVGMNVNHNQTALDAANITYGHEFFGCHWYDGDWVLSNCANIVVDGGTLDCEVINISGGSWNFIRDMFLPGGYADPIVSPKSIKVLGDGKKFLTFKNCWGPGDSGGALSQEGLVNMVVYGAGGGLQSLGSGQNVVRLPAELVDNTESYNPGTGEFSIPAGMSGMYHCEWNIVVNGTAMDSENSYLTLQSSTPGDPASFADNALSLPAQFTTTKLVFSGSMRLRLAGGSRFRFAITVAGTGASIGDSDWFSLCSIVRVN